MTVEQFVQVAGAVALLLGSGGWAAKLGLQAAEQRKLLAEARKAEAEAGGMVSTSAFAEWQQIVLNLREDITRLRAERDAERVARREALERLDAAEAREEAQEKQLRKCLREIDKLKAELEGRR